MNGGHRTPQRNTHLPKINLGSTLSHCREHRNGTTAAEAEIPTPVQKITIKLPPIDRKQQAGQKPIQSTTMKGLIKSRKFTFSSKGPVIDFHYHRPNTWSPESSGSWDYTSMKAEVNRVLTEELQSPHTTCEHTQLHSDRISSNKPAHRNLSKVGTTFCQFPTLSNMETEQDSCHELPVLTAQTHSFGMEVQNVVHPCKKRTKKQGSLSTRHKTCKKKPRPFEWNGIEFHFESSN